MTPFDQDVRDLLRRRAENVPPHGEVPASLAPRVRRRIAFNAALAGAVAVVLAAGAFASVRAFTGSAPQPVGPTPPPTHASQPAPSQSATGASPTGPVGAPACTSADLRLVGALGGAAGSRGGAVRITNVSGAACTLEGTPSITLLDRSGRPITAGVTIGTSQAFWQSHSRSTPPGWPVVTIDPGGVASFQILWSNWCANQQQPPTWRVAIPGGGTVEATGMDVPDGPPPCNGPGQPSTVSIGPFEPGPGG